MIGVLHGVGVGTSFLLLIWVGLLYVPFRWRPLGLYLFAPKVTAGALSPIIAVGGLLLATAGVLRGSWWMGVPAGLACLGAIVAIVRLGIVRTDLAGSLGPDWDSRIPDERRSTMVGRWWSGRLPRVREADLRQDVAFAVAPGHRSLLCDVWRPAAGVAPSGLAMVYLHGSAYYFLDKDLGTRPLFRHLAAQGHVIVDVAYRLFPETDVPGMVADAGRAVTWVRKHAADLGVRPDRIVLAGGSAGGHLALLAAYGTGSAGSEPGVCAVASLYGQTDLAAMYEHASQDKRCAPDDPRPDWDAPTPRWMLRVFGTDAERLGLRHMLVAGRCDWLVGGTPDEVPERYARVSAIRQIRRGCPATLLVHGLHDEMAPVSAVRRLEARARELGVPVTAVYLPSTDHMFDLVATRWSPQARTAIHVLERFLAVVAADAARPVADRRAEPARLVGSARPDRKEMSTR